MINFLLLLATCVSLASITAGQEPRTPLDEYLDTAKAIVIARCISVGPVDILLTANVEVEILYVVKGKESLRTISVLSQYGMSPGKRYLLRTKNEVTEDGRYFQVDTRDSVIEIPPYEDLEIVKKLPARIIVLRTMNLRIEALEYDIRSLAYEADELKKVRFGN